MLSASSRAVDGRDVRVVERREDFGLALETCEAFRVGRACGRQYLHRHVALQLRVGRPVDLAHPAHTDLGSDLIRTEAACRV